MPDQTIAQTIAEISPVELKALFDQKKAVQLIDVREPDEFAFASLPHARLIPLAQLAQRMGELDASAYTVIMCRSGRRSALAIQNLKNAGYPGPLANLKGGLLAWSDDVDAAVPKY